MPNAPIWWEPPDLQPDRYPTVPIGWNSYQRAYTKPKFPMTYNTRQYSAPIPDVPKSPSNVVVPGVPGDLPTTGKVSGTYDNAPSAGTVTPPASTPATPGTYASLPDQYLKGLGGFVGDPAAYYTSRGAEKQAQQDYWNMYNLWMNKTGYALTPDDWGRVWGGLGAYRTGYTVPGVNRSWTVSDAYNYMNRMLARAPEAPQVAYLRTGEI